MQNAGSANSTVRSRLALAACVAFLVLFASVSWLAIDTKSATYDEPYHAVSAWTQLRFGDFRIDSQDPPLWQYIVALPNGRSALKADFTVDSWTSEPQKLWLQWYWCVQTLYRTPGNDAIAFVQRSRAMMLVFGPILGAMIGWWAWRLGGATAAVVATALFCLDPNFLAHAPVVKNDVMFSAALLGLSYALWRSGQALTWLRVLAVGVMCAVMLTVKFSGVMALELIPLVLGLRALLGSPWPVLGRSIATRRGRIGVAVAVTMAAALFGYLSIWTIYGFRYAPTPQPGIMLNTAQLAQMAAVNEAGDRNGGVPVADPAKVPPSRFAQTAHWLGEHYLVPQAWEAGLVFTYQSALMRPTFLNDQLSFVGSWYYFPFAMLVKTPIATLVAALLAGLLVLRIRPRGWTAIALAVPFLLYLVMAMRTNLNIGIRHILPVYPFVFIAVGWAASHWVKRFGRAAVIVLAVLLLSLSAESLSAFPNFIPFFNIASGGSGGGIHLLGDSNLDWGQDLPLLVDWQKRHPEKSLFVSYFGLADPAYYGLKYVPLPGGYRYDAKPFFPDRPCVLAVSATYLQGLYVDPLLYAQFYKPLARKQPIEILAGSIYLFAYPEVLGKTGKENGP
jgi:hypothetical protein